MVKLFNFKGVMVGLCTKESGINRCEDLGGYLTDMNDNLVYMSKKFYNAKRRSYRLSSYTPAGSLQ